MSERRLDFLANHDWIRQALMFEPRGHDVLSGAFFFQAEDGIRDGRVTGVQTCALPIFRLALAAVADRVDAAHEDPEWDEPAVLHVDRVFTLRGIGTVVTGTLWSGKLKVGERVEVQPSGVRLRIRSIQIHDSPVESAPAGQRVALNLTGPDKDRIARGDVVSSVGA